MLFRSQNEKKMCSSNESFGDVEVGSCMLVRAEEETGAQESTYCRIMTEITCLSVFKAGHLLHK